MSTGERCAIIRPNINNINNAATNGNVFHHAIAMSIDRRLVAHFVLVCKGSSPAVRVHLENVCVLLCACGCAIWLGLDTAHVHMQSSCKFFGPPSCGAALILMSIFSYCRINRTCVCMCVCVFVSPRYYLRWAVSARPWVT